jgi:zinc transporter ZupT
MSTKRVQNSPSDLEIALKWLMLATAVLIGFWIFFDNPEWWKAFPAGFAAGVMVMYVFKDTK